MLCDLCDKRKEKRESREFVDPRKSGVTKLSKRRNLPGHPKELVDTVQLIQVALAIHLILVIHIILQSLQSSSNLGYPNGYDDLGDLSVFKADGLGDLGDLCKLLFVIQLNLVIKK